MNRLFTNQQFNTKSINLFLCFLMSAFFVSAQSNFSKEDISRLIQNQSGLKLVADDYKDFEITAQYTDQHNNLTHIYLLQEHNGIDILDGDMSFHITADNSVAHFTNHFFNRKDERIASQSVKIDATEALSATLRHLNIKEAIPTIKEDAVGLDRKTVFAGEKVSLYDIPVRLVYQTLEDGNLTLAWQTEVYMTDKQHYWVTKIDAKTGRILAKNDMVISCTFEAHDHNHVHGAHCSAHTKTEKHLETPAIPEAETGFAEMTTGANFYRVYDAPVQAPTFGERTLVGTSGDLDVSPLGWHNDGLQQYSITKGNNVFAYHDPGPASTPVPAIGGLPGQQPLVFDFEADLSLPPATYRDAAITNLFYWNNITHDIFYNYGFTEAAGNFQFSNFANGGEGLDAVLAEAQDGSGVNNANFLTLADGLPGRMQMFLWAGVPLIDGDFDNGVILHEYGHGISTRLTGGPAQTCLGGDEQGGEGWSDYFGLMVTLVPETVPTVFAEGQGMGTYVIGEGVDGLGIRPAKYSIDFGVNDYTYGDLNNSEISAPHGVGFIWATMLWEMTAKFVDLYGFDADIVHGTGGNNIAMQLVIDGLKLQPCSPTFTEMRDAILAADAINNGGANHCLIWEAFAKRGLGFSAQSGTNARGDETEAFDLPPVNCLPFVRIETEVTSRINDNENFDILINVINTADTEIDNINVSEILPEGTVFVSASLPSNISGNEISFNNLSVPANSVIQITVTVGAETGSEAAVTFIDDLEANPFNWTASPGVDQFVWTTADAFSGDYSFYCANPNNASNISLTLNETVTATTDMELRFAHRYNTEAGFDGGWVEVSNDGGQLWTNAGPLFVQNGYNNFVAAADNPTINGFCFGGNSGGFIHSRVDLSPFAGQEVQVRFRFASDVLTAAEGWYIDDVEFVTNPELIYNTVELDMANGTLSQTIENEILVLGTSSQFRSDDLGADEITAIKTAIYPNPATDEISVVTQLMNDGPVSISLINTQGQVVGINNIDAQAGILRTEISLNNLSPGIYLVHIQHKDGIETQHLLKQ
jgi:uncharacterized repeat protein (TIGR01451 family)